MRHRLLLVALACVLSFTACSSETDDSAATSASATAESSAPSATESESPSSDSASSESAGPETAASDGVVVDVTIKNGEIDPAGDRVEATAGEPITFVIQSDAPGELHVHSTPEHSIDIEPGTTRESITIDQPGIVEAELHDPEVVVVQLEVR